MLAGHASMLTCSTTDYCSHNSCESFGHVSLHTNPLSLHSSWYWETFIQSSCQIVQFLRFKNRQKGDQFFYQMPYFCENCNPPHIIPLQLVNVWLIFDLQKHVTDFVYIFKDLLAVWKVGIYCMLKQAIWAFSFMYCLIKSCSIAFALDKYGAWL